MSVESPVRGDTHAGFGERPWETGREQSRYRAQGRLIRSTAKGGAVGRPLSGVTATTAN